MNLSTAMNKTKIFHRSIPQEKRMAKHIINLSPHYDDAALSCAGLIAKAVVQDEVVQVINIFAGIPNLEYFSAYAQKQHNMWGLSPHEAIPARRQEDHQVLTGLGATVVNWDYCDAIYRAAGNEFLYTNHQKLFGPLHPAEYSLVEQLTERIGRIYQENPDALFYAPLRVGGHVDHLLVRECAARLHRQGAKVVFYEDFPYVAKDDWPDDPKTVTQAKAELPFPVSPEYVEIDAQAKIEALKGYKSQIVALYGKEGEKGLERMVNDYTAKVGREGNRHGYYERYWHPH